MTTPLRPLTPRETALMRAWLDGLTYIEVRMLYGVNSVTLAKTIRALRALGYDLPTRSSAIKFSKIDRGIAHARAQDRDRVGDGGVVDLGQATRRAEQGQPITAKTFKRPTRTCLRCKRTFAFREDYHICDVCKNRKS